MQELSPVRSIGTLPGTSGVPRRRGRPARRTTSPACEETGPAQTSHPLQTHTPTHAAGLIEVCTLLMFLLLFFFSSIPFSNWFQVAKGDFVIIEFKSTRTGSLIKYVGHVLELRNNKKVLVKFLKQYCNRNHEFVFPDVLQIEEVKTDEITSVLPAPQIHRGKHIFPYNVL